jgi:hypothetical protein
MNGKPIWTFAVRVTALLVIGCATNLPASAATSKAVITVTDASSNACQQTVNGTVDSLPVLSKKNHDSISWQGSTASTKITVTFSGASPNLPFHDNPIKDHVSSGTPTGAPGVYKFQNVVLDDGSSHVTCSNPQIMGVHVDQ